MKVFGAFCLLLLESFFYFREVDFQYYDLTDWQSVLQMSYKIQISENFSFQECLWFLDRNYDDCLHEVRRHSVRKLLLIDDNPTLIDISEKGNCLIVNVLQGEDSEKEIGEFVKEWFDIDRDLTDFYQLLNQDADLAYMCMDYKGLRLLGIPSLFEALCWSIIGQQINLTFAYKLKRKLTEAFGTKLTFENNDYYLFPNPEIVANLQVSELLPMQFSTRKAEYLIEIARQFVSGNITKSKLEKMPTSDAIKALVSIRGIGEWTANYALMKSLKRLKCVTYGDVGLYNALFALKDFPKRPSREQLDNFFEKFKNWEAYTVFYLWRSLAVKKKI
jgi:DNA-3-methyladenine glycosylase II